MTWDIVHLLLFFCASALHGGTAIKFIAKPPPFIVMAVGLNMDFNCTTDDAQATVKLFHCTQPGVPVKECDASPGTKLIQNDQVFTLVNAGIPQAGFYKCQATNRFRNETIQWPDNTGRTFVVPSILPPLRVEPSEAQVVLTGQNIELNCYSEGTKTTKLTWFKILSPHNQQVRVPKDQIKVHKIPATNEVKSVLTIRNAKKEDTAGYKCRLSHNGRTKSRYATVVVKDPEVPTIEPYSGKTNVKVPSEKNLPCIAKAFPTPQVTWYKDGEPINITDCADNFGRKVCKNNVYLITENSNKISVRSILKIKQTQYSRDHGTYTCEAKNKYGTASLAIKLNIKVAPKLIDEKDFLAKHGVATNVSCEVNTSTGSPLPEFEWFYQGMSPDCDVIQNCKPDQDKWLSLPTQNQTIHPASGQTQNSIVMLPEDQPETFYLCRAKNNLGNDSQVFSFHRTPEMKQLGCFLQGKPLAFPEVLQDFKGVYKPVQVAEIIKACTKLTRAKGYTHFGIGENLRTCFSGPDVANTYKNGGVAPSRKCRNGLGKRGAIGVFQLL